MQRALVNAIVQDVAAGHKPVFHTWAQSKEAMVQRFKLLIEVEEGLSSNEH